MPLGYPMDSNFELSKDQRRVRLKWFLVGGFILCLIYMFSGRPYEVEVFQTFLASGLSYGDGFYVVRGNDLRKPWLWRAILATVPLHIAYLTVLFWSDKAFPTVMTKALAFVPVLALGFVIESKVFDWVVDRFNPSNDEQEAAPVPRT
jgi:hypothetical protein